MKYITKNFDERYYAGVEYPRDLKLGEYIDSNLYLQKFFEKEFKRIKMKTTHNNIIGLSCYMFDIEDDLYSYYFLTETIDLIEQDSDIITKKLPSGQYVCFEMSVEEVFTSRKDVFKFCKNEGLIIHKKYDFVEYKTGENYGMKGAKVNLCLKVES